MEKALNEKPRKNFTITDNDITKELYEHPYAFILFFYCSSNSIEYLKNKKKEDIIKDIKFNDRQWRKAYKKLNSMGFLKLKTIYIDGKNCGKTYYFSDIITKEVEVEKEIEFPIEKEKPRLIIPGIENIPSVPPSYLNNEKEEELPF
jgi:hypothetical protein